MKLKKINETDVQCKAITVHYEKGNKAIGLILCSGEFVPVDGTGLFPNELREILLISENFNLFYNNIGG